MTALASSCADADRGRDPDRLADRILRAYSDGPIARIFEAGSRQTELAHQVRDVVSDRWLAQGRQPVGRKIGLTSPALRERLGAPEPTDGRLFADMARASGSTIEIGSLASPLAEGELAIRLMTDVLDPEADLPGICSPTLSFGVAIEIVDSRIAGWDIGFDDAIADNGSAALFVAPGRFEALPSGTLTWSADCVGERQGGTCDTASILSDLRWLAAKCLRLRNPLRAGEIVLTGALGRPVPIRGGGPFSVNIDGLGGCSASFADGGAAG